jgi:hypothetical protein
MAASSDYAITSFLPFLIWWLSVVLADKLSEDLLDRGIVW